jgi:hypothetical protein
MRVIPCLTLTRIQLRAFLGPAAGRTIGQTMAAADGQRCGQGWVFIASRLVRDAIAVVVCRLKIQYCMPYSRHLLQSVEVPAVTQVRASTDYQPGNDQASHLRLNCPSVCPTLICVLACTVGHGCVFYSGARAGSGALQG